MSLLILLSGGWPVRPARADAPSPDAGRPASEAGRREEPEPTIRTYDSGNLRRDDDTTVTALAFSPGGATLAAGCGTGAVRFYEAATGRPRGTLWVATAGNSIKALAYSPDGRTVAVGDGQGVVSLWDVASGQQRAAMSHHDHSIQALAYSPDGATLASSAIEADGLRLWDAAPGSLRAVLRGHEPRRSTGKVYVSGLAFSPDGRTLASAGREDKTVRFWDVPTGQLLATLEGPTGFYDVAFSPDGATLAAGEWFYDDRRDMHHAIRLWDVAMREERGLIIGDRGHRVNAHSLTFLPDSTTLVSVNHDSSRGGGAAQLWDVSKRRFVAEATLPSSRILLCSAISPDGKLVAVGGCDSNHRFGSIDLLAVEEGKALRLREPVRED